MKDKIFKVACALPLPRAGNVEIRADYMAAPPARGTRAKTIFTCRSKEEGGVFKGSEPARLAVLKNALKSNFTYVDIELKTIQKNGLTFTAQERKKLIISYHDFKRAPGMAGLTKIKKEMLAHKPAVIKLALTPKNQKEILTLTRFLIDTIEEGQKIILIAMGEKWAFTRVFYPLLGAHATYASGQKSTAPGQLSIKDFERFI